MADHSISPEVRAVLARSRTDNRNLYLPDEQLDRATYTKVAKALELAGGKWSRSARAHVFAGSAGDALESLLLTGKVVDLKKKLQAFYTPAEVAAFVISLADIRPGMSVLEPSAGEGALALPAKAAGAAVMCVELDRPTFDRLAAAGGEGVCMDFLSFDADVQFDRVVMNPPFTGGQDVAHVTHAFRKLKPGGRLVSVMSPSWQTRAVRWAEDFRALVKDAGGAVHQLPAGSFKSSGTSVDTVVVVLDRPSHAQRKAA